MPSKWKTHRKPAPPLQVAPTVPCRTYGCEGRARKIGSERGTCGSPVCERLAAAHRAQAKRLGKAGTIRELRVSDF